MLMINGFKVKIINLYGVMNIKCRFLIILFVSVFVWLYVYFGLYFLLIIS